MAGKARPDGILVPKVSSVQDLAAIAGRLSDIKADPSIRVWAMIETARAVLDAEELAAASRDAAHAAGRVRVRAERYFARDADPDAARPRGDAVPMITHCILAARAYGLEILDGPYSDFSNFNGFGQECTQARDLGFDGKTLIHPGQIEACNAIFTPPAEEVAHARKIIAAFERPENASRGAISARRPDGGAAARRYGAAHDCDRRRDRGVGGENFVLGKCRCPHRGGGSGIARRRR